MKRLLLVLILGLGLTLTACTSTSLSETKASEPDLFNGGKVKYSIVTDRETGCQYVEAYEYSPSNGRTVSITPRLNREGVPMCK